MNEQKENKCNFQKKCHGTTSKHHQSIYAYYTKEFGTFVTLSPINCAYYSVHHIQCIQNMKNALCYMLQYAISMP